MSTICAYLRHTVDRQTRSTWFIYRRRPHSTVFKRCAEHMRMTRIPFRQFNSKTTRAMTADEYVSYIFPCDFDRKVSAKLLFRFGHSFKNENYNLIEKHGTAWRSSRELNIMRFKLFNRNKNQLILPCVYQEVTSRFDTGKMVGHVALTLSRTRFHGQGTVRGGTLENQRVETRVPLTRPSRNMAPTC